MRHEVLFALPLTFTLLAAVPVRGQGVAYRAARPSARLLAPPISDSLTARVRALLSPPFPSPVGERVAVVDTAQGGAACPMPVLQPDSSRQFAAIQTGPLRSGDRMPTRASSCVNLFMKNWQKP